MAECSGLRPATRRNSVLPSVMLDGIPLSVGQRVFVLWRGDWLAGRVGYISSAAVRIDGEFDPSDACQVDTVDVPRRLRFRADGGIDAIREAPTHVVVLQDVSDALVSYHSLRNTAQRAAARTANEIKAVARASLYHVLVLGNLLAQLANGTFNGATTPIEFFSGPFRGMAHSLQVRWRCIAVQCVRAGRALGVVGGAAWCVRAACILRAGAAVLRAVPSACALQRNFNGISGRRRVSTVTVDNNPRFSPDVLADLRGWNVWSWLVGFAGAQASSGWLWLPAHFHFSPPCTTFGWARHFHGRVPGFVGGFTGEAVAEAANACVFAMCYLIAQLLSLGVVVTYTVENPLGNAMWDLPCMQDLMGQSVVLDVSYCLFGADTPKDTRFVCHPSMRFPWADVCVGPGLLNYSFMCSAAKDVKGSCGGFMPAPSVTRMSAPAPVAASVHAGREGGWSILDSEIPQPLCILLHTSWLAVIALLRSGSARSRQISRAEACRLAANWHLEFGPPVAVDPGPGSDSDSDSDSDSESGGAGVVCARCAELERLLSEVLGAQP